MNKEAQFDISSLRDSDDVEYNDLKTHHDMNLEISQLSGPLVIQTEQILWPQVNRFCLEDTTQTTINNRRRIEGLHFMLICMAPAT